MYDIPSLVMVEPIDLGRWQDDGGSEPPDDEAETIDGGGLVSVNEIMASGLRAGATGVRWTDTRYTECRAHIEYLVGPAQES